MSLLGTLAKVAIGIAVAKGASSLLRKARSGAPGTAGASSGGFGDVLGGIFGGNRQGSTGGRAGGLGGLLEQLTGGSRSGRLGGGGLSDLLGGLFGRGADDPTGGLAAKDAAPANDKSFGQILNESLANHGEPDATPTAEQNALAGLMLKAMIQAAKSDGKIDDKEREKLLGHLGDVSQEEMEFVQAELEAPVDVRGLASQVPKGLGPQVYTMSLMAIDLDNQNETDYLQQLAEALQLDRSAVADIHTRLGVASA